MLYRSLICSLTFFIFSVTSAVFSNSPAKFFRDEFPSFFEPHYENEAKCKIFVMEKIIMLTSFFTEDILKQHPTE